MQTNKTKKIKQPSSADSGDKLVNSKYFAYKWGLDELNTRRFLRVIFYRHPPQSPWCFTKREADRLIDRLRELGEGVR